MIIKGLLELIFSLLQVIFSPINIPALPDGIQDVLDEFVNWILSGYTILDIFVDMSVVKYLIPIVIVISNLDKVWSFIMFILRKIPFIGVE